MSLQRPEILQRAGNFQAGDERKVAIAGEKARIVTQTVGCNQDVLCRNRSTATVKVPSKSGRMFPDGICRRQVNHGGIPGQKVDSHSRNRQSTTDFKNDHAGCGPFDGVAECFHLKEWLPFYSQLRNVETTVCDDEFHNERATRPPGACRRWQSRRYLLAPTRRFP